MVRAGMKTGISSRDFSGFPAPGPIRSAGKAYTITCRPIHNKRGLERGGEIR